MLPVSTASGVVCIFVYIYVFISVTDSRKKKCKLKYMFTIKLFSEKSIFCPFQTFNCSIKGKGMYVKSNQLYTNKRISQIAFQCHSKDLSFKSKVSYSVLVKEN